MKQAELTEDQQRLLQRFEEIGGVVDFVTFECEDDALSPSAHHQAVILGLKDLQQRADDYAERTSRDMEIPRSRIWQVSIDEEAADRIAPKAITWQEFLGPRYDFDRSGLIVCGKGQFLNEFFFYADTAKRENIIPNERVDDGSGTGFAYAFSSPPYTIQIPAKELGPLFDEFLKMIIGGSETSTVYEWPTEWSNYFDAGKEWWGSFLWTVSNPGCNRIVVIAASTTD